MITVISNLQSAVECFKAMKMHKRQSEISQTNKVGDLLIIIVP